MAFTPFPPRQPSSSARLPLTLMTLDDWALATISGPDSEKYLQGQITADVSHLTDAQHLLAAHCDAKGKMWSNLRVFRREGGFAWIERRSLRDAQLTELKKYAVFSKVTIAANDDLVLLGVGPQDTEAVCDKLAEKICNLRIFEDENGKMNLNLEQVGGALLVVSQFTLYADCHKGNRPSFVRAGAPDKANRLYEYFVERCKQYVPKVEHGSFGAEII